jgi:hypothetical protein
VRLAPDRTLRVLDFDVETVAAGFGEPDWVPQKITCVAWSWLDEEGVQSRICGPRGIYGKPGLRARMLKPLLEQIVTADMVTGHNIWRFDLPIVNAEAMRLGLQPIGQKMVQDTMWLHRTKGLKKGQDNLGGLMPVEREKLSLDWQSWQDAYDEDGWLTVRRRCESDVLMHKQLRGALVEQGYLRPPRLWRPGV